MLKPPKPPIVHATDTVDSRCSGPLKYVQPPQYTGHFVWHGMLTRHLLHQTHPEVWPLAILFTAWPVLAAPNKVFNLILYVYYGRI